MWEFYLAASETAFRYSGMNNFQIQFARNQHVLPITRNYMIAEEDRLRDIDSKSPAFPRRSLRSRGGCGARQRRSLPHSCGYPVPSFAPALRKR